MRVSNFYLYPLKENPSDAHLTSHKLMIRASMIRQSATGIYTLAANRSLGFKENRKSY